MITDFIHTVTRKQGCLTFAMKKRPTSGDVTYIRTLHGDVDVRTSRFEDVLVLVVLNTFSLSRLNKNNYFIKRLTVPKNCDIFIFYCRKHIYLSKYEICCLSALTMSEIHVCMSVYLLLFPPCGMNKSVKSLQTVKLSVKKREKERL